MLKSDNFNELYLKLIHHVFEEGNPVSPRGQACYEVTPAVFQLTDPRKSLLTIASRKMAYKFNAVEKLCYIAGRGGENILPKFAKNIGQFINKETGRFDGAYGPRLIQQYEYILNLLKKDKNTRQAVMTINNFHDDHHESLDIPCTLSLQLILRGGKLDMIVNMRSNDLMWGLPYDISQFTFIQEAIANHLGVELGKYTHVAGSLHIYERDLDTFENILKNPTARDDVEQEKLDVFNFSKIIELSENVLDGKWPKKSEYFANLYNLIHN